MDQYLGKGSEQLTGTDLRGFWPADNHHVENPSDLADIAAWPNESDIVFTWGVDGLKEFFDAQARREAAQKKTVVEIPVFELEIEEGLAPKSRQFTIDG